MSSSAFASQPGLAFPSVPGYDLVRELGRGHVGVVYQARHVLSGRAVALKLIDEQAVGSTHDHTAFCAGARAAAHVRHPNIAAVHEVGDAVGEPYLAWEFVEGESLRQRLLHTTFSAREAARLVETLARAVHHAHERQVTHGQLSPANVLLTPDGRPRIADFGLAVFLRGGRPGQPFPGDWSYAAPEQLVAPAPPRNAGTAPATPAGQRATLPGPAPAADIYALGATLYALLTGRPPFLAASRDAMMRLVQYQLPLPPSRLHPGLPRDLETICLRCLRKRPEKRYRSALDLATDLNHVAAGRPIRSWPIATAQRLGRWGRHNPVAAGACLLLIVALAHTAYSGRQVLRAREAAAAQRRIADERKVEAQRLWDEQAVERAEIAHIAELAKREQTSALGERDSARVQLADQTRRRHIAEQALEKEARAHAGTETRARVAEEIERQASSRRAAFAGDLVGMHVAAGTRLLNDGDLAGSLPWFTHALSLAQAERLPEDVHRLRLAAILSQCPRLLQAWHQEKKLNAVRLSAGGRRVLAAGTDGAVTLWDAGSGQPGKVLQHEAAVNEAIFSADGKQVITADAGHAVHVWDADSAKEVCPPLVHEGAVLGVAARPVEHQVLTISYRSPEDSSEVQARLWDAATGEPVGRVLGSQLAAQPAEFSPDGKRLLTVCQDQCARIWDVTSGKQVGPALEHGVSVSRASFSPDGGQIVTVDANHVARVWHAATGKPATRPIKHGGPVFSASLGSGGRYVVTAGTDHVVRVWDAATGERVGQAVHHGQPLTAVFFSPDSRQFCSADEGGEVRVSRSDTGDPVVPPLKQNGRIRYAAFDPTGRQLLTFDGSVVRLWDLSAAEPLAPPATRARGLTFSRDGQRAVRVASRTAQIQDGRNGKTTGPPLRHERDVATAAFSPDGRWLLTVCHEGEGSEVYLWDAQTGNRAGKALDHVRTVSRTAFSPDGRRVLTVAGDKKVRLWETATGDPVGQPLDPNEELSLAIFSPSGAYVLTSDVKGTVRVWDVATSQQVGRPFGPDRPVNDLAFSADGKYVATAGSGGTASVWHMATGEPLAVSLQHQAAVKHVAFSPDGKCLATASADRTARIWDTQSGQPLSPPLAHASAVTFAAFSSDGRWLVTASANAVRIWETATGLPVSPDLPHSHDARAVYFAALERTAQHDGWRLVTAAGTPGDPAGRWERMIRPDARPTADLEQLAGVLAGEHAQSGGVLTPIEARKLVAAWRTGHGKFADELATVKQRVQAWENRAVTECETSGLWPGAVLHLGRLIAAAPAAGDLYARRARAYGQLHEWQQAQADYTKALEGDGGRWDWWAGKAKAAAGLKEWEQAAADYTKAIGSHGNDPELWLARGRAEAERGAWDRAAADLGKVVALGQGAGATVEVRYQHALALLGAGDRDAYRRACARLAQRFGRAGDDAAQRLVARVCTVAADALPDLGTLRRQAEQAVAANPRSAADCERLGALLYRAGELEPALKKMEESLKLAGSEPCPRCWLFLALANQRLGRAEAARQWFNRATTWLNDSTRDHDKLAAGSSLSWPERLECQLLSREIEALINGKMR